MKRITLFIFVLIAFIWQGQAQVNTFPWDEGFEGITFPPNGWTHVQVNASKTWEHYSGGHNGEYSASCSYDDQLHPQDEVLMTPVIDLSSLAHPELSFWFAMSYSWAVDPNNNYDLKIQATTDGGNTTTDLWSEEDYGSFTSFTWYQAKISLSAYTNTSNFQLIFRYVGTDGAQAQIDDISIHEGPDAVPSSCAENLVPTDGGILMITDSGEGVLSWDAVATADGYHVSLGTSPGTYTTTVNEHGTQYTTSGLSGGTTYYWKVEPFNTTGSATGCAEQSFTTQIYAVPDCVENPTPADAATAVTIESGRKVVLSWDPPSTGPTPTAYKIELGTASGNYTIGPVTITDTSIPFRNVAENTTYYWKVTAINGDKEASGCAEWSFTTGAFPAAPVNDTCDGAVDLPVDAGACANPTIGDNSFATDSELAKPSCATYNNADLWYKVTVPASGAVTVSTSAVTGGLSDTVLAIYSGACGSLTEVDCNDDISYPTNIFSEIALTGQTPGDILYVRVLGYDETKLGEVNVCAYDPTATAIADNKIEGFRFYPNPVNHMLNLSAQTQIENVSISNVTGQEVIRLQPNAVQAQINMSQLQNGIYFVKAQIDGQVTAFKVVKK